MEGNLPITENLDNESNHLEDSREIHKTKLNIFKNNNKFIVLFFVLLLIIVLIVFSISWVLTQNNKDKKLTNANPTLISTIPKTQLDYKQKLGSSRIAYMRDEKLYLLDKSGSKMITENVLNSRYKFSPDGKYLAWINKYIVKTPNSNYPEGGFPNEVGISLSFLNLATNEVKEVIPRKYTDEEFSKPRSNIISDSTSNLNFYDFDFIKDDPFTIVYIRDGVRFINLISGSEEILQENSKIIPPDNGMDSYVFSEVLSNRKNESLLLNKGVFECDTGISSIYDLKLKKINQEISDLIRVCDSEYNLWTTDGKYIINYDTGGEIAEGLDVINIESKTMKNLLEKRVIKSMAVSKDNKIVGYLTDDNWNHSSQAKSSIYKINLHGKLVKIKEAKNVSSLSFSPDGQNITYLVEINKESNDNQQYNLLMIDLEGNNEATIIDNISSYKWSPI